MESNNKKMIFGEFWSFGLPVLYSLKYFNFTLARGGLLSAEAQLDFQFSSPDADQIVDKILEIKNDYPYVYFGIRRSEQDGVRIFSLDDALFDYHFLFALEIEDVISSFNNQGRIDTSEQEYTWLPPARYRPAIATQSIKFDESSIDWVYREPNEKTGLSMRLLRVDFHHKEQANEKGIFNDVLALLDETGIEYLEYKVYKGNFMMFLGNGRQGVSSAPVNCTDVIKFKDQLLVVFKKYELQLGFNSKYIGYDADWSHYRALVDSKIIVVKDTRYK